jgi:HK97 family phage major capsid protein
MTTEELKTLVGGTIDEKLAPILATQKKYSGLFDGDPQKQMAEYQKAQQDEKLEPGIRMVRLAKLEFLSKGDPDKALKIAGQMYSQDKFVKSTLEGISKKALGVSTGSEGGFLVPEVLAQEVIPLLYSNTVVFELGTRKLDMPNGNLTIPKLSGGASSYYQGENLPAGKSQPRFENLSLKSRKLFTLVPTSNDLIRNSSVSADAIIRDDMIQQMKLKLDWAGLYGDGTDYVPLGIKNTTGIQTLVPGAQITADYPATMIAALKSKNTPMRSPGWAFNSLMESTIRNLKTTTGAYIYRDEMDTKSQILGIPYKTTEQIVTGSDNHGLTDIFLCDWSDFIFGSEVDFEMTSSMEAAYDIGNGTLVSSFSNDQTVLRVLSKHDFGVRHATSFLVATFQTK